MADSIKLPQLVLPPSGTFRLPASKSLANRALVIRALAGAGSVQLHNLSDAEDTVTLDRLLGEVRDGATLDCGPAGTTYRFLTAYLCTRPGTQTLTGSERMLRRPIAPLVDALRELGAEVEYVGEEGYPPLRIGDAPLRATASVRLPGDVSSQYLSALLLVAPVLPQGLTLHWTGELVSRPYLEMTVALMRHFGAVARVEDDGIRVEGRPYTGGDYTVESDWSAASYPATWLALADAGTELYLPNLRADSLQGDRQLTEWVAEWNVTSEFDEGGLRFRKTAGEAPADWECNFETSPDLAQSFAVLCGLTGTIGLFTGLQTLRIKETDRIAALRDELAKVGVSFAKLPPRFAPNTKREYHMVQELAQWEEAPSVATYHDHRMAMSLAALAFRGPVVIEDPGVVGKSFPRFWDELRKLSGPFEVA